MSTKDILLRITICFVAFAILFYVTDYFENKDIQRIRKHQKVGRIFNVNVTNGGTGSKLDINYSLIINKKLIQSTDFFTVEEYNKYSNFIKDSTLIVYDSTGNSDGFGHHRIIYKPEQFEMFNLDRSDSFYQKGFDFNK
jgi:hypothetical protein